MSLNLVVNEIEVSIADPKSFLCMQVSACRAFAKANDLDSVYVNTVWAHRIELSSCWNELKAFVLAVFIRFEAGE